MESYLPGSREAVCGSWDIEMDRGPADCGLRVNTCRASGPGCFEGFAPTLAKSKGMMEMRLA